jgi:hypothetical protein
VKYEVKVRVSNYWKIIRKLSSDVIDKFSFYPMLNVYEFEWLKCRSKCLTCILKYRIDCELWYSIFEMCSPYKHARLSLCIMNLDWELDTLELYLSFIEQSYVDCRYREKERKRRVKGNLWNKFWQSRKLFELHWNFSNFLVFLSTRHSLSSLIENVCVLLL